MKKKLYPILTIILCLAMISGCARTHNPDIPPEPTKIPEDKSTPGPDVTAEPLSEAPETEAPSETPVEENPGTEAPKPVWTPASTSEPSGTPRPQETAAPTQKPTGSPEQTANPTVKPTPKPTPKPTLKPTPEPTPEPTHEPTQKPTLKPVEWYVQYAKDYAVSIGLELSDGATGCWDAPEAYNSDSSDPNQHNRIITDLRSRLDFYVHEDMTAVWVWAMTGEDFTDEYGCPTNNEYLIIIGYA